MSAASGSSVRRAVCVAIACRSSSACATCSACAPSTCVYICVVATLAWPRAETATDYISMGTDADLKTATTVAIQEMVDFLASHKGVTKHQAYQLVSLAGNVAVTQLVDRPVYGVHVRMPKSIFK